MTPTSVGMRCPECSSDRTEVRTPAFAASASSAARATKVLIGINAGVFLLQILFGNGGFDGVGRLYVDGALCGDAVGGGGTCGRVILTEGGEWWRVVTSGFLHYGPIHLALNMFALYVLGQVLEPAIGTARFVAVYLVSLLAGSLGALLLTGHEAFTVGASGAVYGLFVATMIIARRRGFDQVVQQLGFWLVLNLVFTFSVPGISIGGHLGGMAGGALGALLVAAAERRISRRSTLPVELGALAVVGVACFAAAVAVASAGLNLSF